MGLINYAMALFIAGVGATFVIVIFIYNLLDSNKICECEYICNICGRRKKIK